MATILKPELVCNKSFFLKYCETQKDLFLRFTFLGKYKRGDYSQENIQIGIAYDNLLALPFAILTNIFTIVIGEVIVYSEIPKEILISISEMESFKNDLYIKKQDLSSQAKEDLFNKMWIFQPILADYIEMHYIKSIESMGYTSAVLDPMYNEGMDKIKKIHHCVDIEEKNLAFITN